MDGPDRHGNVGAMSGASVLVTYASRHGSTTGVAERIAAQLMRAHHSVDLRPVGEVDGVGGYDAVVLGSPVYNQAWLPEAESFLHHNADALHERPVWIFSVGTFGDTKHLIGPLMPREPKRIKDYRAAIEPRDYRVFAGVIDRHQWPFGSRIFYHAFGGRFGDNRNWPEIDAWAGRIAAHLSTAVPV
jgi:menaquinone-dependent protoporphyrinogen oxidase